MFLMRNSSQKGRSIPQNEPLIPRTSTKNDVEELNGFQEIEEDPKSNYTKIA